MPRTRTTTPKDLYRSVPALSEVLVPKRRPRHAKPEVVILQWHDDAGDPHLLELSAAQSWPYLCKN